MSTLWITRNRHSIAAIVIPVHQASSSPAEDTIFWIVERDRTPNIVPSILPTPPVSIVPPMIEEAMASISMPAALVTAPEPQWRR